MASSCSGRAQASAVILPLSSESHILDTRLQPAAQTTSPLLLHPEQEQRSSLSIRLWEHLFHLSTRAL